ncbi:MAG: hypothetical protein AAGM38_16380 [Pseudomonadota bacterium]
MSESNGETDVFRTGTGALEFAPWRTPFSDAEVRILEVAYAPQPVQRCREFVITRLNGSSPAAALAVRVADIDVGVVYRASFGWISAFRVLDEHGLLQLWAKTDELGGRPARTTFRVRNHAWSEESVISFSGTSDGWSFIIASDDDCLEVVCPEPPVIVEEGPWREPAAG